MYHRVRSLAPPARTPKLGMTCSFICRHKPCPVTLKDRPTIPADTPTTLLRPSIGEHAGNHAERNLPSQVLPHGEYLFAIALPGRLLNNVVVLRGE